MWSSFPFVLLYFRPFGMSFLFLFLLWFLGLRLSYPLLLRLQLLPLHHFSLTKSVVLAHLFCHWHIVGVSNGRPWPAMARYMKPCAQPSAHRPLERSETINFWDARRIEKQKNYEICSVVTRFLVASLLLVAMLFVPSSESHF